MSKLIFLIFLMLSFNVAASECSAYETSHPSYLLDGSHLSTGKCTTCAFCHINGIFVGTPKTCYSCHAAAAVGTSVTQWSAKHIPTFTTSCGAYGLGCHNTTSFTTSHQMNHTILIAYRCDSCHLPKASSCLYSSYNVTCQSRDHPTTGTVGGVKNVSLLGVDCGVPGCHSTTTFNK